MGSGTKRVFSGVVTGTGALLSVKTVGFQPQRVELHNLTSADEGTWVAGMADGDVLKRVAAGTGSIVNTNGVTPLADGFSLGADTDLNAAGEDIAYTCYE